MSKQTLTLDSTQIDAFCTCPRLWYFEHVLRLLPRTITKPSESLLKGTYGHKLLEIYYKSLGSGMKQAEAIENALSFPLEDSFPLERKYREAVKERFKLACYIYSAKGEYVIESPDNVEVGFTYPLYEDDEKIYALEGKIDLLRPIFNGIQLSYVDHKFQDRKHTLYRNSIQFKNYAMVINASIAQVNYIRMAQTVNDDTFVRDPMTFSALDHEVWKHRLIKIYDRVSRVLKLSRETENFWMKEESQPDWSACAGKWGYPCNFNHLCEEYLPKSWNMKKDSLYTIKEEWKPW